MLDIVLVEPEIPHNTGAIARTCAATGARLHLIKPLGLDISDKAVKRCGLDYWPLVDLHVYENLDAYFAENGDAALFLATTKAPRAYTEARLSDGCWILFGKETAGLPEPQLAEHPERCVRLPMRPGLRSLNLSNTVAVGVYEALRQWDYPELLEYGRLREYDRDAAGRA